MPKACAAALVFLVSSATSLPGEAKLEDFTHQTAHYHAALSSRGSLTFSIAGKRVLNTLPFWGPGKEPDWKHIFSAIDYPSAMKVAREGEKIVVSWGHRLDQFGWEYRREATFLPDRIRVHTQYRTGRRQGRGLLAHGIYMNPVLFPGGEFVMAGGGLRTQGVIPKDATERVAFSHSAPVDLLRFDLDIGSFGIVFDAATARMIPRSFAYRPKAKTTSLWWAEPDMYGCTPAGYESWVTIEFVFGRDALDAVTREGGGRSHKEAPVTGLSSGDFESGPDSFGLPAGWVVSHPESTTQDAADPHGGKGSLALRSPEENRDPLYVAQRVAVKPSTSYVLTAFARQSAFGLGHVAVLDASLHELASAPVLSRKTWVPVQIPFESGVHRQVWVSLRLRPRDGTADAAVAFDDVLVTTADGAPKLEMPELETLISGWCPLGAWTRPEADDEKPFPVSFCAVRGLGSQVHTVTGVLADGKLIAIQRDLDQLRESKTPGTVIDNRRSMVFVSHVSPTAEYTAKLKPGSGAAAHHRPILSHGSVARRRVPLNVEEPDGIIRRDWPVSNGVPLPYGELASPANARLLGPDGKTVPAQLDPLAIWDDSSIRWLLVTFLCDLQPKEVKAYTLEYGNDVKGEAARSSLEVRDQANQVEVSTGAISFEISRERGALLQNLRLGGQGARLLSDGADFVLTDADGRTFHSARSRPEVVVEEAGPLRAVVRMSGKHASPEGGRLFEYRARLYAYAKQPWARVLHTIVNSERGYSTSLREIAMRAPLQGAQVGAIGAEERQYAWDGKRSSGLRLYQRGLEDFRGTRTQQYDVTDVLDSGPKKLGEGRRATGWVGAVSEAGTVRTYLRHCWQSFPTALEVGREGISLGMWPKEAGEFGFGLGGAKTHEIFFEFAKAGDSPLPRAGRKFERPLLAIPDPKWSCDASALGSYSSRHPSRFGVVEAFLDSKWESTMRSGHATSYAHFGDVGLSGGGYEVHGEIEVHGVFCQFLRSGDRRYFDFGDPWVRHSMDLDIRHAGRNAETIGAGVGHPQRGGHKTGLNDTFCHTGADPAKGYSHMHGDPSHTWLRCFLDYYFFTGDRWSLETAKLGGQSKVAHALRPSRPGGGRTGGMVLQQLMELYLALWEPDFLDAARATAEQAISYQCRDGSWYSWTNTKEGLARRSTSAYDKGGLCTSIMLNGLKNYYKLTRDPRARKSFIYGMDWMIWQGMTPGRERGFLYGMFAAGELSTQKHHRNRQHPSSYVSTKMMEAVSYAHNITGEALYREIGTKVLKYLLADRGGHVTMSSVYLPYFLHVLADGEGKPNVLVEAEAEVLRPGESGTIAVHVKRDFLAGNTGVLRVISAGDLDVSTKEVALDLGDRLETTVRLGIGCGANARLGTRSVELEASLGEARIPVGGRVSVVATRIGIVNSPETPAAKALPNALAQIGVPFRRITNVYDGSTVSACDVIFVGAEAHHYDVAMTGTLYRELPRYAHDGGVLVLFQLQNTSYRPDYLPFPVALSDQRTSSADIVVPGHPLFTVVHRITDASGITSYDSFTGLGEQWQVLVRDSVGGPSIAHARHGKGHIILCQCSLERVVGGGVDVQSKRAEQCKRLFENLVKWASHLSED